jgi:hypothetical protein
MSNPVFTDDVTLPPLALEERLPGARSARAVKPLDRGSKRLRASERRPREHHQLNEIGKCRVGRD